MPAASGGKPWCLIGQNELYREQRRGKEIGSFLTFGDGCGSVIVSILD